MVDSDDLSKVTTSEKNNVTDSGEIQIGSHSDLPLENSADSLAHLLESTTITDQSETELQIKSTEEKPLVLVSNFVDPNLIIANADSEDEHIESITTPKPIVSNSKQTDSFHQVKWILFGTCDYPIITQNNNGPCPMIALFNFLLLQGKLDLPKDCEMINGERIIDCISNLLLSLSTEDLSNGQLLNYETNVSDALSIFPSLQTGLDINVRFTGVADFEYTPALCIFDLFNIPLFHGWVMDPQDIVLISVIEDQTYNQVVEMIINSKSSSDPNTIHKGILAQDFFNNSASQLTYHGLCELNSTLAEGHLGVFFRNNHFSTIYKYQGCVYSLVTDAGLVNEPNCVWETLNDVDGNTHFVNSEFKTTAESHPTNQNSASLGDNPRSSDYACDITRSPTKRAQFNYQFSPNPQNIKDELPSSTRIANNFNLTSNISSNEKIRLQNVESDFKIAQKLQAQYDSQEKANHEPKIKSTSQHAANTRQSEQRRQADRNHDDPSCSIL